MDLAALMDLAARVDLAGSAGRARWEPGSDPEEQGPVPEVLRAVRPVPGPLGPVPEVLRAVRPVPEVLGPVPEVLRAVRPVCLALRARPLFRPGCRLPQCLCLDGPRSTRS